MASTPSYEVKLKALWDNTDLKMGSNESERALEDLAREFSLTADKVRADLNTIGTATQSTLGSGGTVDRAADDTNRALADVADTAREEVPGALLDLQDGAASAAQGLAGAFANMGPGGTVIGTVLAGFAILSTKSAETAQAMRDKINSALESVQVKAGQTNAAIQRAYEKQLTFNQTVADIGGGDAAKGYEILKKEAEKFGVEVSDIVNLQNGVMTDGAKELLRILKYQTGTLVETGMGYKVNLAVLKDTDAEAQAILERRQATKQLEQDSLEILRENRDTLAEQKKLRQEEEFQMIRNADLARNIRDYAIETRDAVNGTRWGATNGQARGD